MAQTCQLGVWGHDPDPELGVEGHDPDHPSTRVGGPMGTCPKPHDRTYTTQIHEAPGPTSCSRWWGVRVMAASA